MSTELLDSGARREFASGAVRDIDEGKGRMDLIDFECAQRLLGCNLVLAHIRCFLSTQDEKLLLSAMRHFIDQAYGGDVPTALLEVSKQFQAGCEKYGEFNFKKGIPLHCYIDSALRHYMKYLRGNTDEPHDRAVLWNLMCCRWTLLHRPDYNDIGPEYAE